ncbi:hypothetical protein SAY86_021161 [Trapa natans]|uniref:V-type proton ATPase subunit E n=1 Tax=Trapa natans TaxID=22666 RepID=A0AAN7RCV4_TRANT|nr:hypothetical protein SAY86_021161 [Trapa natans]
MADSTQDKAQEANLLLNAEAKRRVLIMEGIQSGHCLDSVRKEMRGEEETVSLDDIPRRRLADPGNEGRRPPRVWLKEPAALLRCRKDDVHLVESVLDSAGEEYAQKANVHPPVIEIDHRVYLPPPPSHKNTSGLFCSGGVVLASRDGKIVCENTLDARLDVVFRKKLPEIRKWLFGQVAA